MFKKGRRYWYVLGDGYLAYYKAQETPQLLGVIDLREVVLVEEVGPKMDKKPKKEVAAPASFNLITSTRAYQLQAESFELRKEWVGLVRAQIEGGLEKMSKEGSLAALMDKAIGFLKTSLLATEAETSASESDVLKESALAPYTFRKIKKLVRIEGAKRLTIWFDTRCSLVNERHALRFYRDSDCSFLIASYSSSGVERWQPIVIEGDHFWYTFKRRVGASELDPNEWGFKFTVWAETPRQLPLRASLALLSWALMLDVAYWPTIALSIKESIALLLAHLCPNTVLMKPAQPPVGSSALPNASSSSSLTASSALTLAIGLVTTKPTQPLMAPLTYARHAHFIPLYFFRLKSSLAPNSHLRCESRFSSC